MHPITYWKKVYRSGWVFVNFRLVAPPSINEGLANYVTVSALPRLPLAALAAKLDSTPSLFRCKGILCKHYTSIRPILRLTKFLYCFLSMHTNFASLRSSEFASHAFLPTSGHLIQCLPLSLLLSISDLWIIFVHRLPLLRSACLNHIKTKPMYFSLVTFLTPNRYLSS